MSVLVFANGCFDGLHAGHVAFLQAAARLDRRLIVGLNSDASVRRLKGEGRPRFGQEQRRAALLALPRPFVAGVYLFDEDTAVELVWQLRPDVLAKGEEYRDCPEALAVESYGGRVVYLPRTPGVSTTEEFQHAS